MPSEVGSEIGPENAKVIGIIMGGERKAVDLLIASRIPRLRRAAAWIFPNSDKFEDAVRHVGRPKLSQRMQFQRRGAFASWLYGQFRHLAHLAPRQTLRRSNYAVYHDGCIHRGPYRESEA
jgi:hypothetical protein